MVIDGAMSDSFKTAVLALWWCWRYFVLIFREPQ